MSSTPPSRRSFSILAGLLALALLGQAVLLAIVFDLRGDVDDLSSGRSEAAVSQSELNKRIDEVLARLGTRTEELRKCFNKALEDSFSDFSRYAFGLLPPPRDVLQVVETCASLADVAGVRPYKLDLNFPVDLGWEEGTDRIFFTEKETGKIRVLDGTRLLASPCYQFDVNALGSRGTLGLVLDPDFAQNHWLYVYYTNESPLEQRVTRLTVEGNRCTKPKHIVTAIPADPSAGHNGGQLEFVGDKLFVSVGDGYEDPDRAQDLNSLFGKILRYNRDGSIPSDNPFSKSGRPSPIWAYGVRNPFGLAHGPNGNLYATDNGPNCDDELNLIVKGGNYGSGNDYDCGSLGLGEDPEPALLSWTPPIVPTDLWFYTGPVEELARHLFFGDFGAGRLHKVTLNDAGTKVVRDQIIYDSPTQIVDVTEGPKGLLYLATPTGIYKITGTE